MLSDTDPLLPSCSEPYQLGLTCVPDRDHSRDTASAVGERRGSADDHAEQLVKSVRPTSKEFTKTWGFRRTTIAQRETPPDSVVQEAKRALALTLTRRGGRQAKRGHQAPESVPTAKPGRGGRRSAPASLGSPKPPSETSADAGDPSETGVTAACVPVAATEEPVETPHPSESKMPSGLSASEGATSSDQADSEELTLKELQERIRRRRRKDQIGPLRDAGSLRNQGEESSLDEAADGMPPGLSPAEAGQNPVSDPKPSEPGAERAASPSRQEEEQGGSPSKLSGQSHRPDSLYCICRQKHNDRFMICCDRCDEWFHGDCVGVSAAQGRRLERSGQEYTCPSCAQQKIAPAPAPGPEGAQQEAGPSSCLSALPRPDTGEDCGGDQAIKGKIERATNPGEKRRIKIFQPLEDTSGLPQCMGPGCGKSALPDSVYCGAECIIKHAAAAMKSLTSVKEPAAKGQAPKRPAAKSAAKGQKRPLRERAGRRSLESRGRTEEDESSSGEEAAVEPNQTSPPWSRDHNCIAAKPENTTAIPSAVFYKAFGLEREAMKMRKDLASAQVKPPHSLPEGDGKSPSTADPPSKRTKLVSQPLSSDEDTKQSTPPPNRGFTSVKRSPTQTFPSPPSHPPATGRPNGDASRLSKASCKVPGKPSTPQHPPPAPPPAAGLPSSAPAALSQLPQSPPNLTVRHNARRSLVEILNKRVSDYEDLDVPERNVLKIAVGIEKELYGLFSSTGHNYKNKYRSIMFNLKDPKKKGLLYQVMMGKVTPFRLVRLSAEELSAKDMAGWTLREKAEASEGSPRAWSGRLKAVLKLENCPVSDTEDSSALPGNTCVLPAASSTSAGSAPERPGRSIASAVNIRQASVSVFSTMLTDTTAEHRTHLFNLNCRICTGRVSEEEEEEEPAAKRLRTADDEKDEPEAAQLAEDCSGHAPSPAAPDSETYIMESPASPDDPSSAPTSSDPISIPAVSCVVIAGRDPRTAGYRPPVPLPIAPPVPTTVPPAAVPVVPTVSDSHQNMAPAPPPPPLPAPPPPAPKSILKPASSSQMRFFTSSGHSSIMDSHSSPNGDTAALLSKQKVMWKGFINMQNVAKFVTKAYRVSGSCELLEEDLPDTVQIGGRISPDIVWDYVMKVKTSVTKELCLMRFHPASEEEQVAYISLFSYFNSRGRFGVVANNSHRVKDLYLIPLSAKAPIPSKLGPVEGPGLEANHPNLLLGLAICQKPKCPGAVQSEKGEEKRSRVGPGPPGDPAPPELPVPPSTAVKEEKERVPNQDVLISTSPPGSPSSVSSSDSSSSFFSTSLLLQRLKPLAAPAPVTSISSKETSSSTAPAITPLQTILKTLFGKNKPESQGSQSPPEQNLVKKEVLPVPILDPVLQQFCRVPNEKVEGDECRKINHSEVELNLKTGGGIPEKEFKLGKALKVEADEDDRPYDPEEEYYPGMGGEVDEKEKPFNMETEHNVGMSNRVKKEHDRPYDPEEEYNPEICYWTEEDDDGDDRPYDLEEEYNSKIAPGEAENDDDRPYDPEEEYNLGMGCGTEPAQKNQTSKLSEAFSDDEVAYDPEDDSIFEEVKGHFADSPHRVKGQLSPKTDSVSGSESLTLTEQRKMLEELNKQIEEQERQLAEQEEALRQQRAAVGESLAHFSVSDALMSPPLKPLITNEPLQSSRNKELVKRFDSTVTDSRSLPSQTEDPWQAATDKKVTSDGVEKDCDAEVLAENAKSSNPDHTSQSPSVASAESPHLESGSEVPTSVPEAKMDSGILCDLSQESTREQKIERTIEPKNAVLQDSARNVKDEKLSSHQIDCPEHFQTTQESKPIQKPLRSILRNKTSHRSSETPKTSCDSAISKADSSECTVKSEEVKSPDFRGPKEMPRSSPFRSSSKSSPKRESRRLQGERDPPQLRCSSKFQATDARPSYRHRRGERRSDFPCRLSPSAGLVPRGPRPSSPMDPPSKFDQNRRSLPRNNMRPRGRSPNQFMDGYYSPPPLDVRDDSRLLSPSLEFSGLRGPHNRPVNEGPRLNDSHGFRGRSRHSEIMDQRSPKPLPSVRRCTDAQYRDGASYEHRMERDQEQTPRMCRENSGSSQARYLGPVRQIRGQRSPSPPKAQPPSLLHPRLPLGQKRKPSENQNGPQHPELKRHRGPPSSHLRGPQHNLDNFTGSVGHPDVSFEGQDGKSLERPVRRALLPTPTDGPIFLPRLMGDGPDHHRKDWRHSPDMRSGVKELDSSESRDRMFGGYRHDDVEEQFPSRLQAERQQELPGDRGGEWDDSPIRDWERNWSREQERGCDRGLDEEKHWGEDDGHEPVRDRELPEPGQRRHKGWNRRDRERSRIRDRIKDQKYDRHHPDEGCGHPLSREHGRHHGRDHGRGRSRNIQEGCNLRDRCRREEET